MEKPGGEDVEVVVRLAESEPAAPDGTSICVCTGISAVAPRPSGSVVTVSPPETTCIRSPSSPEIEGASTYHKSQSPSASCAAKKTRLPDATSGMGSESPAGNVTNDSVVVPLTCHRAVPDPSVADRNRLPLR